MFQTKVVEEMKTRILCSITSFVENHAFYEIKVKQSHDRPVQALRVPGG